MDLDLVAVDGDLGGGGNVTAVAHVLRESAEHGIGRAKNRWLHLSRSASELEAMQSIKSALDPEGLLNPGVLVATP